MVLCLPKSFSRDRHVTGVRLPTFFFHHTLLSPIHAVPVLSPSLKLTLNLLMSPMFMWFEFRVYVRGFLDCTFCSRLGP